LIQEEEILSFLGNDGPFFKAYPHFEVRDEQKAMLQDTTRAFNDDKIALIEAGTGTGKSLAYLLPAILFSIKSGERVLISTRTINLQEQLISKDIPMLKKALGLQFKAVLAKGMGNYICLRRLHEALEDVLLYPSEEGKELAKIDAWSKKTQDGTRAHLPVIPSQDLWERIGAERDACTKEKCPHYKECFFFKARKEAQDAKIIIANHSLLLSDLAYREKTGTGLLPDYARVIIDEAHHLEDVALEHMAEDVSFITLAKTINKLHADKGGKLASLISRIKNNTKKDIAALIQKIEIALPDSKTHVVKDAAEAFDVLAAWAHAEVKGEEDKRFRIQERHLRKESWKQGPEPRFKKLLEALTRYITDLELLVSDIALLKEERVNEATEAARMEITSLGSRLRGIQETIKGFIHESLPLEEVRWIDSFAKKGMESLKICIASLDVAKKLEKLLFNPTDTVILCSATLATSGNFSFLKKRLGISLDSIEKIYPSSFDYPKQAMLAVAQDLPTPIEPGYFEAACDLIFEAIKIQPKGVFILSTSFAFLEKAYGVLEGKLKALRFSVFKQGSQSKNALLEQFKKSEKPVLFATDSFWEGVDVQGGVLKLVIITRLPFKVPDEPLVQAMAEKIIREGGDPFMEDSLPDAIVKFKQGFGRLIRNKKDHGCVLCLDKRLITKQYGREFLKSLPDCQREFLPKLELLKAMKRFYYTKK